MKINGLLDNTTLQSYGQEIIKCEGDVEKITSVLQRLYQEAFQKNADKFKSIADVENFVMKHLGPNYIGKIAEETRLM
jgi:predicted transcriptional regulator YdeE